MSNDLNLELLNEINEDSPELFAIDVRSETELSDKYNVFRSFLRGTNLELFWKRSKKETGMLSTDGGSRNILGVERSTIPPIDQHYVDVSLVEDSFLR
jgi:hypothetical protein